MWSGLSIVVYGMSASAPSSFPLGTSSGYRRRSFSDPPSHPPSLFEFRRGRTGEESRRSATETDRVLWRGHVVAQGA